MSESSSRSTSSSKQDHYWRKNLSCLGLLLVIWFVVSYGCGILFVDQLDQFRLPGTGFKLGFWFAQQGSIYTFVVLIWVYVRYMNKLDSDYRKAAAAEEGKDDPSAGS